jgi:hypothetical protein
MDGRVFRTTALCRSPATIILLDWPVFDRLVETRQV